MVETTCHTCGTMFLVKPSRLKYGFGKYCRKECGYAAMSKDKANKLSVTCAKCGKVFEDIPANVKNGRKYCSRECQYPPHYRDCLQCGKEFRYSPSANQKFCSATCSNASEYKAKVSRNSHAKSMSNPVVKEKWLEGIKKRSKSKGWKENNYFQPGKNHPNYKHGKSKSQRQKGRNKGEYARWRKAVLSRDNYTCQKCNKRGGRLVAHHIKPWSKYPDLRFTVSNGKTVCEPCHDAIHGVKHVPKTRECEYCKKPFLLKRNSRRFCSLRCAHKGAITVEDRQCPKCLKLYHPKKRNQIHCSAECLRS